MNPHVPVFVKIDEYKDVLDTVNLVKGKMVEARSLLHEIATLKEEEDAELEQWQSNIDEIESKITAIDKALFADQ
ncbi:hypothetical protein AUJ68_04415 [Candidatus Woesearchaeota archaeon CG1_02_57_44]|nr:MAG: hypothetical protein AUJ68_04415 [Candidatus Woesearchaeota archaeon CG1_02_57_44]